MDRLEQVKDILSEELHHWMVRKSFLCWTPEEKTKLHGACCELMMYAGFPEKITAEYLRERYRMKIGRTKKAATKNHETDLVARNRAVKACAAIQRLGIRIKIMEESIDKRTNDT